MCKENTCRRSSWRGAQTSGDPGLTGDWLYSKGKESLGKVLRKEVTYLIYISKTLILAAVWTDNRGTRIEAERPFPDVILQSRFEIRPWR